MLSRKPSLGRLTGTLGRYPATPRPAADRSTTIRARSPPQPRGDRSDGPPPRARHPDKHGIPALQSQKRGVEPVRKHGVEADAARDRFHDTPQQPWPHPTIPDRPQALNRRSPRRPSGLEGKGGAKRRRSCSCQGLSKFLRVAHKNSPLGCVSNLCGSASKNVGQGGFAAESRAQSLRDSPRARS